MQRITPLFAFVMAFTLVVLSATGTPPPGANKEKILHRFTGIDGSQPHSTLVLDSAGNLYGTTSNGGAYMSGCNSLGCGTVYQLTRGANGQWTETVIHSFTGGKDGSMPFSGVILDSAGNLYGTTSDGGAYGSGCNPYGYGCGTVFRLTQGTNGKWTEKVLHSFGGGEDGAGPTGVIFGPDGSLYGTNAAGGVYYDGEGTVFRLAEQADGNWTEQILHSFGHGKDGSFPVGGVVFDKSGNLYGATLSGGAHLGLCQSGACGTVFELTPEKNGSWKEKVLHSFGFGNDGVEPLAGLAIDSSGILYGTTYLGGRHLLGTVFQLVPGSNGRWKERLLHSFGAGHDGFDPSASLTLDSAGNLYGTTPGGGSHGNYGTVFRLTPEKNGHWTETILQSFGSDGKYPYAGVLIDESSGDLYGATIYSETSDNGTVFKLNVGHRSIR